MKITLEGGVEKELSEEQVKSLGITDTTNKDEKEEKKVLENQSTDDKDPVKQAQAEAEYYKNLANRQADLIRSVTERQDKVEKQVEVATRQPGPTKEQLNNQFWADPTSVIKNMFEEMVAPLKEAAGELRATTAYDRLKGDFKNDPAFAKLFRNPAAEQALDRMVSGQKNINKETMLANIMALTGAIALNQVPGVSFDDKEQNNSAANNNNTSTSRSTQMTLPPHLRPSAPSAPSRDDTNKPKIRELTENEERMRRENKMTHEDFLALIDIRGDEVIHSKIGIKPNGGTK